MSQTPGERLARRVDELSPQRRELVEQMLRQRGKRAPTPAISRRPPSMNAPLSYAQQRMWLLEQLALGTAAHNMDTLVRVQAPFDVPSLQRALNEIIRRHESLRTTFRDQGEGPVQIIGPYLEVRLPVADLRYLPASQRLAEGIRIATEDARAPFDLEVGPLVRSKLYRLDDEDYLLLLTMHHIVSDFVSMTVFFDELIGAYESFSNGLPSCVEDVPLQYADFACWQRNSFASDQFDTQLSYWRTRLAGVQELELLTDMQRPPITSTAGATYATELPPDVVRSVRELSASAGMTAFTIFLAAFKVLLFRYTRQTDVVVGVPTAGRSRPELQRVIGFFVNSLVMRTDLSGDPTFRECMTRVAQTVTEAIANQDVPFEKLVEDLQPARRLNQNPLFQIAFQLLPVPKSVEFAERVWIDRQTSALDLAVELIDSPDRTAIRADYAASLFHHDTIAQLVEHFAELLRAIVANPDRRISELELLTPAEQHDLVTEWSGSAVALVDDEIAPAHVLVETQARLAPGAVAIHSGGVDHTYAQLDSAVRRIAAQLRNRDVGPRDLVAVAIEPSFDLYASMLGILRAGAAYLPLDITQNDRRTDAILSEARPSAVLTVAAAADRFAAHERVIVADTSSGNLDASGVAIAPDDPAYVIFTSGSSGRPKGVVIEHRALANQLRWMQETFPLHADDCVLQKYPIAFDAAAIEIFGTLGSGARLVPIDRLSALDTARLASIMREQRVTVFDAVPSLLAVLIEQGADLRSLRRIIAGGEALPPDLLARLRETGVPEIVNMYGPTEATITATAWLDDGRSNVSRVPIGRPIRNMVAYVLDERLQLVPVGTPGELYLGGVGIAREYVHAPELTADAFVANPFGDPLAPRLYRTGDMVRLLPDRNLEYLGRTDRQVKVRGHRVAPEEIEAALRDHPGVADCAVLQQTDADGGGLTACIVASRAMPELWPSVGEYPVYDELLYHAMTSDTDRNRAYRSAIDRTVRNKVVLDIGTGADLLWARASIEAGARHVYAIEALPEAAARATAKAAELNLSDRVTVIQGDARDVALPEPADVIVSELIGTIASSEGAAPILNDARRLLRPDGIVIPQRAETRVAAVELPAGLAEYPTFTTVSGHYVRRIFDVVGHEVDLRLCVKGVSRAHLLSDDAVFETLDFSSPIALEGESDFDLSVHRAGTLHGLLLWMRLDPGGMYSIDTIDGTYSWLPVFVPLDAAPLRVRPGDRLQGVAEVSYPEGHTCPDYRIAGRVIRTGAPELGFDLQLPHSGYGFSQQPFYRGLFRPDGSARTDGLQSAPALRAWLAERLPAPMVPDAFKFLSALPRTATGKLDAAAISAAPRSQPLAYAAPRSEIERLAAGVWARMLQLDRVGVHDNFFDLGGHSLLLVRLQRELRQTLSTDVSLSDLFQFPTISALADALQRRRSESVVSG